MEYHLERTIESAAELGAARLARILGLHSGEISYRKARDSYGKWFTDEVKKGNITPCRVEDGRAGTRWFSIEDIIAAQTKSWAKAIPIFKD